MFRALSLLLLAAAAAQAENCLFSAVPFGDQVVTDSTAKGSYMKIKDVHQPYNIIIASSPGSATVEIYEEDKYVKTVTITFAEYRRATEDCSIHHQYPDWIKDKEGKFSPPRTTDAARNSLTAATALDNGDMNGDGFDDKVSVQPNGVVVQLGSAAGLRTPVRYTTPNNAEALVLADFNDDRFLDIAVASSGGSPTDTGKVSILLGTGSGTFGAAASFSAGLAPVSLAKADFNKDGKLDLAVANRDSGNVSVLLGNGDGTFQAASAFAAGDQPASVLADDLNGDQLIDLAVANRGAGAVTILLGNASGGFQPAAAIPAGARPSYLGASDLNGDGKRDLVVLHRDTATVSVWLGTGSGAFQANGRYLGPVGAENFAFLDVAVDDRPTILLADATSNHVWALGVNLDGTLVGSSAYPVGLNASALAVADFNGDAKPDAVAASNDGLTLFIGDGLKFQAGTAIAAIGTARASTLASADFNGDGRMDLAVGIAGAQRITILIAQGNGTFQTGTSITTTQSPVYMVAADFNRDNRPDLAVIEEGSSAAVVNVYLATAGGAFQEGGSFGIGRSGRKLAAGDLNGDGRPDLAAVNYGDLSTNLGKVTVALASASGTFQTAVQLDAGVALEGVAVADFDGDGKLDVAATGTITTSPNFIFGVGLLRGRGDGTFQPMTVTKGPDLSGLSLAGDFNRDGLSDLVLVACCGDTGVVALTADGNGGFNSRDFGAGADPIALAAADLDGDGADDLVALDNPSARYPGVVVALRNNLSPLAILPATNTYLGDIAPDSIASIYGARLAVQTTAAPSAAWPQTLAGTSVTVKDSNGVERPAGLALVSPGQINFHVPGATSLGWALVTVKSGANQLATYAWVDKPNPGFFVLNSNALAAALVLRVRAIGEQVVEQVYRLSGQSVLPAPIDLGPAGERVFLLLFGTGIRLETDVRASIGGTQVPVAYAGAQGEYPGFDQVNFEIPRSLAGAGLVDVVLAAGKNTLANVVRVQIR